MSLVPDYDPSKAHVVASIQHAVVSVKGLDKPEVLVAGSLHLVGGVMEVAGLQGSLGMV